MARDWHIRRYREGDGPKIVNLLRLVFNIETDLEYWTWKYEENPVGFEVYVAEDKNQLVAHYGLVLSRIKVGYEVITASQAVDIATRSDYQGRGIFVELGKRILQEVGKNGVPLSYGFPNDAALPGHMKVGWTQVCMVPILIKPLNVKSMLRKYVKNGFLLNAASFFVKIVLGIFARGRETRMEDLSVIHVSSFDKRVDEFWHEASRYYNIIQVRNREFLNWRYVKNPQNHHTIFIAERNRKLLGYMVLEEKNVAGRKVGYIVDVLTVFDDGEIGGSLIARAVQYFRAREMDYVLCVMQKWSIYYRKLRQQGFVSTRNRWRLIVHLNGEPIPWLSETAFEKWYFTMGDSD